MLRTKSLLTFALLVLFIFFIQIIPLFAEASPEEQYLSSDNLKFGRYDELIQEWLDYVEKNPRAPFSEFLIRSIPDFNDYLKDENAVISRLEKIERNNSNGFNKLLLQRTLLYFYAQKGDYKSAEEISTKMGFVSSWAFIGPWGFTSRPAFYEAFEPEKQVNLKDSVFLERRELKWRLLPQQPDYLPVDFFDFLRPQSGAVYGMSQVKLPELKEGYLIIRTQAAFKLWLNNSLVFEADRLNVLLPEEFIVPVTLNSDWNQIMIKIIEGQSSDEFQMQLVNKDYKPFDNSAYEKGLQLHDFPQSVIRNSQSAFQNCIPSPAIEYYRAITEPKSYERLTLGLLYFCLNDYDKAFVQMEKACGGLPSHTPFFLYYLALIYDSSPLFPLSYRQTQVKDLTDKILSLSADFLPAYFLRAQYYESQDKTEEALFELRKSLKINPGFFYGYLYGARIAEKASRDTSESTRSGGWKYEQTKWLKQTAAFDKENPKVLFYEANCFQKDGNYQKARELYERIIKERPIILKNIISLNQHAGRLQEVIDGYKLILSRQPNNPDIIEDMAKVFADMGNYKEALVNYETLNKLIPHESKYLQAMGDLYQRMGKSEEASRYYAWALQLNPSDIKLRRYLAYLNKKEEDFAKPFYINVAPLLTTSFSSQQFPRAKVAFLVDQGFLRVYEDGSYTEVIHQAYRILNEEGIERYSNLDVGGELMEARVYRRDGTVLEPTLVGGRKLTLPGIEVGCVVEYKYRVDSPKQNFQFNYQNFYFQDPSYDAPLLISELVVITPKDFPFKYIQRNFAVQPKISEENNLKIYQWHVTMAEHVDSEPRMPNVNEILPHIRLTELGRSWDDVVKLYQDSYLGRAIVTELITKESQKVTDGKKTVREKTESLYYFVDNLIRETAGGEIKAQSILITRKGNRLVLLKALLDTAGIESYFVLVRQPANFFPEPEWELPNPQYFIEEGSAGALLMIIQEDGLPLWVCGEYRGLLFGDLPLYVQGGRGLVIPAKCLPAEKSGSSVPDKDKEIPQFVTIPQLPIEQQASVSELTLLLDEITATGKGMISFAGISNSDNKNNFLMMNEKEKLLSLERELNEEYPGFILQSAEFDNLNSQTKPLKISLKFVITNFVSSAGEELKCRNGLKPLGLTQQFISQSERKFPLQVKEPFYRKEKSQIIIPDGHNFVWTPESVIQKTNFGNYELHIKQDDKTIFIERIIYLPSQKIQPADYPEFIKFCSEIDRIESRPIRFSKIP